MSSSSASISVIVDPLARRHLQRIAIGVPLVVALRNLVVAVKDRLLSVAEKLDLMALTVGRGVAHDPLGKRRCRCGMG